MFTCSQAIEHARRHPVIGPLLPQEAFAAQPVPVWDAGRPAVGLLFYRISGKSGEPKTIHPPVLRALIDADGRAQEVVAAPRLWKAGERGREALGTFPGPGLRGKSRAEMDTLFHQCAEAADALLEQAKQVDGDWTRCDGLSAWRALYAVVGEEGLRPYFAGWDIPFADSDSKESELAPGPRQRLRRNRPRRIPGGKRLPAEWRRPPPQRRN